MIECILFPSDYFNKNIVDAELQNEYNAVVESGKYQKILLFSYEDWFERGVLKLNELPSEPILTVYRGWMMSPLQYERFYEALKTKNIVLFSTPLEYRKFHVFPNIYPVIQEDTPKALFFEQGCEIALEKVKKEMPRFMVKDYVKSVKGTDFPVFFENSVAKEDFMAWLEKFYCYRGNLLTGGICIKEYIDLKRYNSCTNEYRAFYFNGSLLSVCKNSNQGNDTPLPPKELLQKYENIGAFYTIDYAETSNGAWVILETGDGGVSGLPDEQNALDFFEKLSKG